MKLVRYFCNVNFNFSLAVREFFRKNYMTARKIKIKSACKISALFQGGLV
jgi:hypothetical protein